MKISSIYGNASVFLFIHQHLSYVHADYITQKMRSEKMPTTIHMCCNRYRIRMKQLRKIAFHLDKFVSVHKFTIL